MEGRFLFNGIAIFGAPGSGKSTMARALRKKFPQAVHLEASLCVIYPAASLIEPRPKTESDFIKTILTTKTHKIISREQARSFFIYLKNIYSPSVIAKTIVALHKNKLKQKFVIIAGIRGYRNATYFKKNNYLVVYLKTPSEHAMHRLAKRESFSRQKAEAEQDIEERLFSTNKVEEIAHLSFYTSAQGMSEVLRTIEATAYVVECRKCVNSSINLSGTIGKSGLCDVCQKYQDNFDRSRLLKELQFILSLRGTGKNKYDALVGISGGKDSTATLYESKRIGFKPLAFSLDTGYYPKHIYPRARQVAQGMSVDYKKIDARLYIRPSDRTSFEKTAKLYDQKPSLQLREKFRRWYIEDRRHYSIKCSHAIPFVRTCQLCRRIIIRAYYAQALKYGVRAIILGVNEWAGLSQDSHSKKFIFSGIRKLKPFKHKPAVYVIHLPFILQRTIKDTYAILRKLGWHIPRDEALIESNSNSCLFARAAEAKASQMLGFHPDATRLAREVTVGFITKKQAHLALAKKHSSRDSVRSILHKAKII